MTDTLKNSIFKIEVYGENDDIKITNEYCLNKFKQIDQNSLAHLENTVWRLWQLIESLRRVA